MAFKSSMFWDITSCSPLKVNLHTERICYLYLQGWKVNQARSQHEAGRKQDCSPIQVETKRPFLFCAIPRFREQRAWLAVCFMFVSFLAYSSTLKWRKYAPAKRRSIFNVLHSVVPENRLFSKNIGLLYGRCTFFVVYIPLAFIFISATANHSLHLPEILIWDL
jgi:hypothetical protein